MAKNEEEEHELHVPRSCWAELALTHTWMLKRACFGLPDLFPLCI